VVSCTTTDGPLCSGGFVDGTVGTVCCSGTGDAFTGVMGTTRTSAWAVSDLGHATFIVALGAGSFGVVPLKPGSLRGVGTTMAALVPELVTSFLTADYLDPDNIWIGINNSMSSRFAGGAAGGATGDDVGGTVSSGIDAVGPVTSTAVVAGPSVT